MSQNTHVDATTNLELKINADPNSSWANGIQGNIAYDGNVGLVVSPQAQNTASFTFKFNQKVQLLGYSLINSGSFNPQYTIEGDESFSLSAGSKSTTQDATTGDLNFNNQFIVEANEVITLTGSNPDAGVDWLLWTALRVQVIPEPQTYAVLLSLTVFAGALLKRRFR